MVLRLRQHNIGYTVDGVNNTKQEQIENGQGNAKVARKILKVGRNWSLNTALVCCVIFFHV